MQMQILAGYWQRIESTASRLEMTEILAHLLRECTADEIKAVSYMSLGNLGPAYLTGEFGVAEKMLIRVIALAFDHDEEKIATRFKDMGDLGLVVEEFGVVSDKEMSVIDVYSRLQKIGEIQGDGSQEAKIVALAGILKDLDGLSRKYVVRLVLGRMRLGFSDMTLLDGLSWMVAGDKSLHKVLEHAFNVMADVGEIALIVKGTRDVIDLYEKLEHVHIQLGVPVVSALCQREETFDQVVGDLGMVACEPKYDGNRVQIHFKRDGKDWQVRTFTRNMEENSGMFPELIAMGSQIFADEVVLDGEAMGYDSTTGKWLLFAETMTRKRKHGIEEAVKSVPLKFMIFDVLYVRGVRDGVLPFVVGEGDCHLLKLEQRRQILEALIGPGNVLEITPQEVSADPEFLRGRHAQFLAEGLEGAILKGWQSSYVPGRKGAQWIKMKEVEHTRGKLSDTIDCVVMGYDYGQGKRAALGVGALLLGVKNGEEYVTLCKLGTGMSDDQLRQMSERFESLSLVEMPEDYRVNRAHTADVWMRPEIVVEVAGDELTRSPTHTSGWGLRFPRMIRIREDKGIDGVTSVEELEKIRL